MIRRIAFLSGLVLGSSLSAWALALVLTYAFTGKIPSIELGGKKFVLKLVDLDTLYETPAPKIKPAVVLDKEGM